MKCSHLLLLGLALTMPAAAIAEDNQVIFDMVKAGVPVDAIVASVKNDPGKYDHSPAALIALAKAGVPQPILTALAGSSLPFPSQLNPSFAAQMPTGAYTEAAGVTMLDGGKELPLTVAPIGLRLGMMKLMTSGFLGKSGGIIRSGPATSRADSKRPSFRVGTPVNIDPKTTWGIVRLQVSGKNYKFDLVTIMNQSPKKIVPVSFKRLPGGAATATWIMSPDQDMEPGEYIVIAGAGGEDSVQSYQFGIN